MPVTLFRPDRARNARLARRRGHDLPVYFPIEARLFAATTGDFRRRRLCRHPDMFMSSRYVYELLALAAFTQR
jgi:hypothetical protein